MALLFSASLLAARCSLLAHDLGHARAASHKETEVAGITLWLFGGVARLKGTFPSAEL